MQATSNELANFNLLHSKQTKRIYGYLVSIASSNGLCSISQSTMYHKLHLNIPSIQGILKILVSKGLIAVLRSKSRTNIYSVVPCSICSNIAKNRVYYKKLLQHKINKVVTDWSATKFFVIPVYIKSRITIENYKNLRINFARNKVTHVHKGAKYYLIKEKHFLHKIAELKNKLHQKDLIIKRLKRHKHQHKLDFHQDSIKSDEDQAMHKIWLETH